MIGEQGTAAIGTVGGFAALLSAAACCVLPLALAVAGLTAGGLALLVPYHWLLTIGSGLVAAAGWALYLRKRRACSAGRDCAARPPARMTLVLLCLATLIISLSALWPNFIEAPLMAWIAQG